MAKFRVEFPNGRVEDVEQSDCATVAQYINCRFGRGAKPKAKVTLFKAEGKKLDDKELIEAEKAAERREGERLAAVAKALAEADKAKSMKKVDKP